VTYSSPEAPSRLLLAVSGDLRPGLAATFADAGFVVTTALHAGDVDCLTDAQTLQVVVLDTELGGEPDALRACRALRAKASTADVPVLLLIASSGPFVVDHGLESGVTDVAMRVSPAALVMHRVQEMLRVKRTVDDLQRSESSLNTRSASRGWATGRGIRSKTW
jgi:DNA-binding response OmpR family regulator